MKQSIVNLLRFWSCYLKQISIKSIVFSITIATFFFFSTRYLARWSRSINDDIVSERRASKELWNGMKNSQHYFLDLCSLIRPYYFKTDFGKIEYQNIIKNFYAKNYRINSIDTRVLIEALIYSGDASDEMSALNLVLNSFSLPSSRNECILLYYFSYYRPMIYDLVSRGDYYAANEYIGKFINIYLLVDDYDAFSTMYNDIYLLNILLQDRWLASTNRLFVQSIIEQIISGQKQFKLSACPKALAYIQDYFNGLNWIRDKKYADAYRSFIDAFNHSEYDFVKELSSLMIIRSSIWEYDQSKNNIDYQEALSAIEHYSSYIKYPFFKVDLDGYIKRLRSLK